MLFNAKINEIQSQVSANSLEIDALLLRVEELRAQNLAMENHLQQLGSAENAAESAIEQIKTALMMINAISPTEVQTFKGAIDSLFDCERPQLAAYSEPIESDPDPEPEPSGEPDSSACGEPAESACSEPAEPAPLNANVEVVAECEDVSLQNLTSDIAYHKLEQLPFNKLRALAKHRKVSGKGDAHDLIKRIFESGITPEEVEDFRSSVA